MATTRFASSIGMSVLAAALAAVPCSADDCIDDPIPELIQLGDIHVRLIPVAEGLTAPHTGVSAPGDPHNRLFVGEQTGIIWSIDLDTGDKGVLGDLSDRIVEIGPGFDVRGMMGMTIHPEFMSNGLLYTWTSESFDGDADFSTMPPGTDAAHQTVLIEWTVPDPADANAALDPASARIIMVVDQPQSNVTLQPRSTAFGSSGSVPVAA